MKNNKSTTPSKTSSVSKSAASTTKRRSEDEQNTVSVEGFWSHYSKGTDTHTKMIDLFIIYLIMIVSCQVFYRFIVGDDFPRNAFVSGVFCPIGVAVLLVILRGRGRDLRQLAEFFLACLVLFITAINFAG